MDEYYKNLENIKSNDKKIKEAKLYNLEKKTNQSVLYCYIRNEYICIYFG